MIVHRMLGSEPALGSGIFGLSHRAEDSLLHLVPVPFEATVSYGGGTAEGPEAILAASSQVDLFDSDFGAPHRFGFFQHPIPRAIKTLSARARKDAEPVIARLGDLRGAPGLSRKLKRVNAAGDTVNAWLERTVSTLLDQGRIVGIVGGDHSVPFGTIRAHAKRSPGLGILHFDAHADLRVAYEGFTWSHASIMFNVVSRVPEVSRIVQVGIRDFCEEEHALILGSKGRIRTFFERDQRRRLHGGESFAKLASEIVEALPQQVYISFDIDGLDPRLCPGTGTPVPGGLDVFEVISILKALVESGRQIVAFDLNEVAPSRGDREWNANVGARVLHLLIGATLLSRTIAFAPSQRVFSLPSSSRSAVVRRRKSTKLASARAVKDVPKSARSRSARRSKARTSR